MTRKILFRRILLGSLLLSILTCTESINPISSSSQYKDFAKGFWKAINGDTLVTDEIVLIAYNWYAIDTKSESDSVYITWDDGIACTRTASYMKVNIIEMTVDRIHGKFTIKNDLEASVMFKTDENLYEKQLLKIRNDPKVLCD